jgi:glycosyltransferase 2 family protein
LTGQRWRLLAGALVALALLAFFFRGIDGAGLARALAEARVLPLVGFVLLTLVIYAVRAWRWGALLAPLGQVRYADLFSATMVGFASGLLIPRAGELLRPWLVSRRYKVATSAGLATIVLERIVDMLAVLVLFAVYLFVLPAPAEQREGRVLFELWGMRPTAMTFIKTAGAVALAGAVVALGVLAALHANPDPVMGRMHAWLAKAPRWLSGPLGTILHSFADGLAVLQAPLPQLAKIVAQSIGLWLLVCVSFHLNNVAFGIVLPLRATILLIAFLVVGVLIPTPGTVGGFHAFYLIALSDVFGVERARAGAAAISGHLLGNLPVLVLGLVLLGREGLSLGSVAGMTRQQDLSEVRP